MPDATINPKGIGDIMSKETYLFESKKGTKLYQIDDSLIFRIEGTETQQDLIGIVRRDLCRCPETDTEQMNIIASILALLEYGRDIASLD